MDELDLLFYSINEADAEELLKNIELTPVNSELSESLKRRMNLNKKESGFSLFKLLPFAAVFLLTITCVLVVQLQKKPAVTHSPSTEISTTMQAPVDNPLMVAISTGNEDIIQKLLSVPDMITSETLDFALNLSNTLSYNTIHEIALKVRDTLGSTGLDTLVESALLGDSQKALTELKKRDQMLMTPFEKLAFLFAVAFCNSEVVEEFVARGYDINTTDSSGNSIYAVAKKYGNEDTMSYAISKGITY